MSGPANANVGEDGVARKPGKAIMPLLSLRRHWRKSVLVFSIIALAGLPVAYVKGTAVYYGEAVLQVNFRYAANFRTMQEIETHSDPQYRRLVQQQLRTITRFDVLKRAMDGLGEARFLWQKPDESERKAIQRLGWALQKNAVENTYLVTVGMTNEDPEIIPLLVNAVVESYLSAARDEIFFGSEERLANLEDRKALLEESLAELGAKLQQAAAKLGLSTFDEGLKSPSDRRLSALEDELLRAQQERIAAVARLEAMRSKHERLLELSLEAEAQKMTAGDRPLGDLRTYLYQRRARLVQTMSGLKPSHAGRQAAEEEIARINAEIERATADTLSSMIEILRERRASDMRSEAAELEAEVTEATLVEDALAAAVKARKDEVRDFRRTFDEGVAYREEMERQRRQLAQIRDRIDEILLEEDAPGYVRLVSKAVVPEEPISGGRKKIFIVFLVLASGAAAVLPLVLDFLDSRIRTPIDLHRIIGFEPTSWLPEVTEPRDRVLFEQQLERLGVALVRDLKSQDATGRTVFVAETLPGAGKTLLAHLLGDELQRLGLSTLIVSCDPANVSRSREVESMQIPGAPNNAPAIETEADQSPSAPSDAQMGAADVGLVDLIAGRLSIDEVTMHGGAAGADRIGFGSYDDALEAGNIVRLNEVLAELAGRYDVVLVDGPAMLMSATAEAIASFCYATLLVVSAINTPVKPLKRALSMIERAEPELVGAVLNRAPVFRGGGYYARLGDSLAKYRAGARGDDEQSAPKEGRDGEKA